MADRESENVSNTTAQGSAKQAGQGLERSSSEPNAMQRRSGISSPFSLMRRLSEDMDRMFGSFFGPSLSSWDLWPGSRNGAMSWPEVNVTHQGNKLIIHADVPGMKKEDVHVEARDNEICISGERRSENRQSEGRSYRSERSYGSFSRTIPLPEGAKADTATAHFDNGVLTIEVEAPEQSESRGRRIEVRGPH